MIRVNILGGVIEYLLDDKMHNATRKLKIQLEMFHYRPTLHQIKFPHQLMAQPRLTYLQT